ncbi:hypothetical protein FDP41_003172 [Naegleria fowleri]|uniref:glutamate--tRNA ligase n=1 Tax=Naegleria fowleri TaxID=5763 RepID=A0A6A5BVT6_NAEFO|nr:uncharacterized protein FDP41_003172 [Naegleria fowleri]KAF0977850.1 hypothetical protein FDP41_003172 [Naegleria fowleri]CAG4718529.1 unnamed protein product [Naegleria fowleri]
MNTILFNIDFKPIAAFAVVCLTEQKVNFKVSKNPAITLAESVSGVRGNFNLAYILSNNTKLAAPIGDFLVAIETANEISKSGLIEELDICMQRLDNLLLTKTYLYGEELSVCDLCVYESLKQHKLVMQYLKRFEKAIPNLVRYFTLIHRNPKIQQSLKTLENASKAGTSTDEVSSPSTASSNKTTTSAATTSTETTTTVDSEIRLELPHAEMGKVVTRFPPEASGFLHIGHAKAALMNSYFAKKYNGKLVMRFDDTNPDKEREEYEHAILEDLERLKVKPDIYVRSSDHFDKCMEFAEQLIREGKAYMDDTPVEELRKMKMEGTESHNRNNTVEKNMQMWKELISGTEYGKKCVLRAKIDMKALNKTMRDPVLFRSKDKPHPKLGDKYKAYPTYDFVCPIVDSLDGVTHALRTSEYNDRNEQYYWIIDALGIRKPFLYDFSRLNFANTVMSKRKLQKIVDMGVVEGWNDPRFPTVQGLLRRGLTVEALYAFILEQGASRNVATLEWDKLWAANKKVIDPIVPRYCAIDKEGIVKFKLTNGPQTMESRENPKHKKNASLGMKTTYYTNVIYLDKEDAEAIEQNEEITLMDWGNAIVQQIIKNDAGKVVELVGVLHLEGDFKKTKKKLTWLPTNPDVLVDEVFAVYFDNLISKTSLDPDDKIEDVVNRDSKLVTVSIGDHNLKTLKKGEIIQLERRGYFICDVPFDGKTLTLFNIPDSVSKKTLKK